MPPSHRVPRRSDAAADAPFRNAVDTDPAVAEHRAWAAGILQRAEHSEEGVRTLAEHTVTEQAVLDEVLSSTQAAGRAWGARPAAERAEILRRAGDAMEAARGASSR